MCSSFLRSTRRRPAPALLLRSLLAGLLVGICAPASAQFADEFDDDDLDGWTFATGDGNATMTMLTGDGAAAVMVDASKDRHNVWWALIKREVSRSLDLTRLNEPHHELRIEARIRVSHAPRRVNLHLNTQRTTDFHTHLMEFDIPDTTGWHTISMTTRGFDARPGDTVNGQMALMDWGRGSYRVELDYFRVDVVDTNRVGPDYGEPIPYHPPLPAPETFTRHVDVAADAVIDIQHPDLNLDRWRTGDRTPVLIVDGTRYVLLRWDPGQFKGLRAAGPGLLTLTTYGRQRADYEWEEFGRIRVVEIVGGDPNWSEDGVTLHRFTEGRPLEDVVNGQMIIDVEPAAGKGDTTYVTISRPVLQRLIDGTTRGLILRPLGPISASFYAREHDAGAQAPTLHFSTVE